VAGLFLTLGCLFLAGLAVEYVGRRTRLPRVSLLIALGIVVGPPGFDLLPGLATDWHEPLTVIALTMVAFLLGGALTRQDLQRHGRAILLILCAGAAERLGVSPLIAGMTAGALVANLARHHVRPFREIEHIQWPFILLFFVLAGAALDVAQLAAIGGTGAVFILLRVLGRALGGWSGAARRLRAFRDLTGPGSDRHFCRRQASPWAWHCWPAGISPTLPPR